MIQAKKSTWIYVEQSRARCLLAVTDKNSLISSKNENEKHETLELTNLFYWLVCYVTLNGN